MQQSLREAGNRVLSGPCSMWQTTCTFQPVLPLHISRPSKDLQC